MLKLYKNKIHFFSDSLTRELGLEVFTQNIWVKLLSLFFINFKLMLSLSIVFVLAGCGTTKVEKAEYVWPLPPEQPRIKFVDIAQGNQYFVKDRKESLLDLLAGEPNLIVLMRPFGVVADATGTIYVTDTSLKKVVVFDKQLNKVRYIGDSGNAKLHTPIDIVVTSEKNIFVTDSFLKRVFVFDSTGKIIRTIGNDKFVSPTGIAYDEKTNLIYVVDTNQHTVLVFDKDGEYKFSFGERGNADGQFNFPTDIVIVDDRVYVVDTFNGRIQIFDTNGKFLYKFGELGTTPGHFSRPKGIAVDSDKNIYVTDAAFDNFQIFNQAGEILMFVGSPGTNIGEFNLPAGIFIDSEDKIYVVDQLNSRIQIFQYIK